MGTAKAKGREKNNVLVMGEHILVRWLEYQKWKRAGAAKHEIRIDFTYPSAVPFDYVSGG